MFDLFCPVSSSISDGCRAGRLPRLTYYRVGRAFLGLGLGDGRLGDALSGMQV